MPVWKSGKMSCVEIFLSLVGLTNKKHEKLLTVFNLQQQTLLKNNSNYNKNYQIIFLENLDFIWVSVS